MRKDHRPDESDPPRNRGSREIRGGDQQVGPEEEGGRRRDRQVESLEQPQGQDGLQEESTAKRVDAEERRQPIHDAARRTERLGLCRGGCPRRLDNAIVEEAGTEPDQRIEPEHGLHGVKGRSTEPFTASWGMPASSVPSAPKSDPARLYRANNVVRSRSAT